MLKTAWGVTKFGCVGTIFCYGVGTVFTAATGGAGTVALAGLTQSLNVAGQGASWAASFAPPPPVA